MHNSEWLKKYTVINNSYSKIFVYRLGAIAGFFSEYNNMIVSILYCLENKIQFRLSSKKGNFAVTRGWTDFFEPFCVESQGSFHLKHNVRPFQANFRKRQVIIDFYKKLSGIDYLLQDLWSSFHNDEFINSPIYIPELNLSGTFLQASQKIIEEIWLYRPDINDKISAIIRSLQLPGTYVGIHIRGGDKSKETSLYNVRSYVEKLIEVEPDIKSLYVATDDYNNITKLKKEFPSYSIYTLCSESSNGHIQSIFDSQLPASKYNSMLTLLADVDILSKANKFIGTYSSNIGIFIGMRVGEKKCHYIDSNKWKFWTA